MLSGFEAKHSKLLEEKNNKQILEIFPKLQSICHSAEKGTEENSWATGHGINQTLIELLGDTVHVIHPDTSSVFSLASDDKKNAIQGSINYTKIIEGFIQNDGGELRKPIVMVINTEFISIDSSINATAIGGNHWQTYIILPKNYVPFFGDPINNHEEIVFFIDAFYEQKTISKFFKLFIQYGVEYSFVSEGKSFTHQILPLFQNAKFVNCNPKQQLGGSDCGWWAVYNALMLISTGKEDFLQVFQLRSREPAYILRALFPLLSETLEMNEPEDFACSKNTEPMREEEFIAIQHAIAASLGIEQKLDIPTTSPKTEENLKTTNQKELTFEVYLEKKFRSMQDVSFIENRLEDFKKKLSQLSSSKKVRAHNYFELSECYTEKAVWLFLNTNDINSAYQAAFTGYHYFNALIKIGQNFISEADFYKTLLRYVFLFSFLNPVSKVDVEDLIVIEYQPELSPPSTIAHFLQVVDALHKLSLLDSEIASYQGYLAATKYKGFLSILERLTLIADALIRLDNHPCRQELEVTYNQCLNIIKYFPFTYKKENRFLNTSWGVKIFLRLCDNWIMQKVKNKPMFRPSRELRPLSSTTVTTFSQLFKIKEFYLDAKGRKIDFEITVFEHEFIRFISHLHPVAVTMGTSTSNPAFIVDLALQQQGFLDPQFRFSAKKPLKRLEESREKVQLFQAIKTIAPKFGCRINEEELKKHISTLYKDTKQRLGAIEFFLRHNFESFDFTKALLFLYKGLSHDHLYLPTPDQSQECFEQLRQSFEKVKNLMEQSFHINMHINAIIDNDKMSDKEKILCLKEFCEALIKNIVQNDVKIILQIQVRGKETSHAIYGILEATTNAANVVDGIQLVLSNGGYGCRSFEPEDRKKRIRHVKRNKSTKPLVEERVPISWHSSTNWTVYLGEQSLAPNDYVPYKAIKIAKDNNKSSWQTFCNYLVVCCSGKLLTASPKNICLPDQFMDCLYNPKNTHAAITSLIELPNLNSLAIVNVGASLPKQLLGNCTVHNAMYAIKYAAELSEMEFWFVTTMLEVGVDEWQTSLVSKPQKDASESSNIIKYPQKEDSNENKCYWCVDTANRNISITNTEDLKDYLSNLRTIKAKHPQIGINLFASEEAAKKSFEEKIRKSPNIHKGFIFELHINQKDFIALFMSKESGIINQFNKIIVCPRSKKYSIVELQPPSPIETLSVATPQFI